MSARKNKLEKQLTRVQGRLTNLLVSVGSVSYNNLCQKIIKRMSEQGQLKGTSRPVEPKEDKGIDRGCHLHMLL